MTAPPRRPSRFANRGFTDPDAVSPERLPLGDLQPNPFNPRYDEDDPEVLDLANSMRSVGQLHAVRVVTVAQFRGMYPDENLDDLLSPAPWVVFIGNRRLAAAPLADRTELDVKHDSDLTTADELEDRILVENVHRKDLPPLKEAGHLRRRLSRRGATTRSVGKAIGKSHTYVEQRIALLGMLPELQAEFRAGRVSIEVGRKLGKLSEAEQRAVLHDGPPYARPGRPPAPGLPSEPAVREPAATPSGNGVATPAVAGARESPPPQSGNAVATQPDEAVSAEKKPAPPLPGNDVARSEGVQAVRRHVTAALNALEGLDLVANAELRGHLDAAIALLD